VEISVLITTCRRPESLGHTLAAVARLEAVPGHDHEVLVIENGASAETRAVVARHPAFKYLSEPIPGASRVRNRGVAASRGNILLFLDDDVRPEPGWLKEMWRPLATGMADGINGDIRMPPELERDWMEPAHRHWLACVHPDQATPPAQLIGASMGLRREVFTRISRFDDEMGPGATYEAGEEGLFSAQMERAGFRLRGVPEARAWHHFAPERLRREAWLRYANRSGQSVAYIEYHWRHEAPRRPRLSLARATLRRRIWRLTHPAQLRRTEGISMREFYLDWHQARLAQHVRFARAPRVYPAFGLSKLAASG
jgi:glycosyltransferase involved in cell wall biosynthesis